MVGLPGIQMAFETLTLWHPTSSPLFEYLTSLVQIPTVSHSRLAADTAEHMIRSDPYPIFKWSLKACKAICS